MTQEEIQRLIDHQLNDELHPYTCNGYMIEECKRDKSYQLRREGHIIPFTPENEGVLIPTLTGWICPCGKYKQNYK